MPVFRSLESRILAGRREPWLASTRDVKKIVDKHGANLRVLELLYGGHPGTVIVSSIAESFDAIAARTDAVNADPELRSFMTSLAKQPDFPFAEPVEVRLSSDITEEVGGGAGSLDNVGVFQLTTIRLRPGLRDKLIGFIRQMREVRGAAGRPKANVLQVVAGDPNAFTLVHTYPNLAAWAKDRAEGQPKGAQDVLNKARSDAQFPYADPIATRVFREITAQL